jgi:menaquinone-dependent protoporphyrinogen oxidase
MFPVLVLYATREGQTRRIAEYISDSMRARGFAVEVVNATELPDGFSLGAYSKVIVAASVHRERHQKEIIDFVKGHRKELDGVPGAFVSVSLSQAGAEDSAAPPERRAKAAADVEHMIFRFLAETGWHPSKIKAVAGALMYTKYNFVLRFVIKRVAKAAGGSTDTSRDHEYTDWIGLDRFLDEFLTIPVEAPASRR